MKTVKGIKRRRDRVIEKLRGLPASHPMTMNYHEGFRDALDWVLSK